MTATTSSSPCCLSQLIRFAVELSENYMKMFSVLLGTLGLVVSSSCSVLYSFSIAMEKPEDPSGEKKGGKRVRHHVLVVKQAFLYQ